MKKRRHPTRSSRRQSTNKPAKASVKYLLEQGTLESIGAAKTRTAALLKYYWDHYSDLARQRNEIQDDLIKSLVQTCISNYQLVNWQRAVKYKYSLHPLSTVGSLTFIGGRFNTGKDVNSEIPSFPALYLASDKDTALQETLGQSTAENCALNARELALTNPQSETIVSVSGEIEKVFDLRTPEKLIGFVDLIKSFKFGQTVIESAKSLGLPAPDLITNPNQLIESFLVERWQEAPSQYDIPANSQLFGHLIYQAGIEGILYPSKLTKKDCLAVFPHNFVASSSYLVLDDESPHSSVPKRIDSSNWRICDLFPNELEPK